jgi:membrane-anchored protein YejM (alkaline phosphatase superfamily)
LLKRASNLPRSKPFFVFESGFGAFFTTITLLVFFATLLFAFWLNQRQPKRKARKQMLRGQGITFWILFLFTHCSGEGLFRICLDKGKYYPSTVYQITKS